MKNWILLSLHVLIFHLLFPALEPRWLICTRVYPTLAIQVVLELFDHPGYTLEVLKWLPRHLIVAEPLDLIMNAAVDHGPAHDPLHFILRRSRLHGLQMLALLWILVTHRCLNNQMLLYDWSRSRTLDRCLMNGNFRRKVREGCCRRIVSF